MEFLSDWKLYGFRVAKNNFLLRKTMKHIGACCYHIDYKNDSEHN